jgi:hypothetical protein
VRIGLLRQLTVYSKQFHLHLRLGQHLMLLQPSFSQSMVVWMSPFITTLQPERRHSQLVQPPASWICAAMGSLGKHCKTYVRRVPGIFTLCSMIPLLASLATLLASLAALLASLAALTTRYSHPLSYNLLS